MTEKTGSILTTIKIDDHLTASTTFPQLSKEASSDWKAPLEFVSEVF